MHGLLFQVIKMKNFREKAVKLAEKLFGPSEIQNRVALSAIKLIVGDVVTLFEEFQKTKGAGALFFNPTQPSFSRYMTVSLIKTDIILAEEIMDKNLVEFLRKLLVVIENQEKSKKPVVVLVDEKGMSIHVIDINQAEENLNKKANAASAS